MLPFSLCNKKRLAIRHMNTPLFSNYTIDSVLRHREVGWYKDLSATPRSVVGKDTIQNRTRDLTVYSALPQSTAPPPAPYDKHGFMIYYVLLRSKIFIFNTSMLRVTKLRRNKPIYIVCGVRSCFFSLVRNRILTTCSSVVSQFLTSFVTSGS